MDQPYIYEICVEGHLPRRWSDWFGELVISSAPEGKSILRGPLPDQAALFGVLSRLHDLNLILVSVKRCL